MSEVVVACRGVGKTFRIPSSEERTLRGKLLHPGSRTSYEEFCALESVDIEIRRGEFFGVVGRNGSGKSTLLKVLAGIYKLDRGEVEINGSIAPFIELGVGFNEDLSARDNVYINGAILGMSRRQIDERFDAIVEFAELHEFMESRLRNFSSGMLMRLAFAIAVQSGAEILLVDEVLAVGDGRFQRKCQDVFRERKRRGETVVFVSHDMNAVEAFCDRVLLLERGTQVDVGPPAQVVPQYHDLNRPVLGKDSLRTLTVADEEHPVVVTRFVLTSEEGEAVDGWSASDSPRIRIEIATRVRLDGSAIRVLVLTEGGALLGALSAQVGVLEPDKPVVIDFVVDPILGEGGYGLEVEVHAIDAATGQPRLVAAPRRRDVWVDGERAVGVVRIPHQSTISASGAASPIKR